MTAFKVGVLGVTMLCSTVAGAATLRVGPSRSHKTVASAVAAAKANDVIEIDPGEYVDDTANISVPLTIRGVGATRPHLRATKNIANGKGIFVLSNASGAVTFERLELSGARVVDDNGAGIRAQGAEVVVRDCYFHDNQNGILGGAPGKAKVLIEHSEFYRNGDGSGQTHNVYISSGTAELTFRYNYSHAVKEGHLLKSRADVNYILYNRLVDEDGDGSAVIDLPEGGRSYVIGNLLQQGSKASNTGRVVWYNLESPTNPELELYFVNNTVVNDNAKTTNFIQSGGLDKLVLKNNLFVGPGTLVQGAVVAREESNNVQTDAPGLVDRAGWNYQLTAGSPAIDKGVAPGTDPHGYSLVPKFHYAHPRDKSPRFVVGAAIDVGAYEYGTPAAPDAAVGANDGGVTDSAPTDGAAPERNAGEGGLEGDGAGMGDHDGGCGCHHGGTGSDQPAGALLALVLLLAGIADRRARRPR